MVAAEAAVAVDRQMMIRMTKTTTLTILSRKQRTRKRAAEGRRVSESPIRSDAGNVEVISTRLVIEPARGDRSSALFAKGRLTISNDVPGGMMPPIARGAVVGHMSFRESVRPGWKNNEGRS